MAGEADAAHEVEEEGEEEGVEDGQGQADASKVARAVHVPQPANRAPAPQSQVASHSCQVTRPRSRIGRGQGQARQRGSSNINAYRW